MKKIIVLISTIFFVTSLFAQDEKWYNSNLDMQTRISALVDAMTLDEKISQTVHNSAPIERLNVEEYNWWSEALHGVARSGRATIFPQAIGMAATFDPSLLNRVGVAVSDEARAINNHLLANGKSQTLYQGLTFWSPNVNIFRDPRWGRGQETYGEDPYLSGQLGASFIKGMRGSDSKYIKVATCAKHFAVHSGPEALRHEFNAIASPQDLRETYLPAFKSCVDAGVDAVMCAYNRTNDEACCGSKLLLQDILSEEWNFQGHILSDCWALENVHKKHKLTSNPAESAALALQKGVNLNCGVTYAAGLKDAIDQGLVTEKDLDKSLKRLFETRFRLGMFDDPADVPYRSIGIEVINDKAKQDLALEVAQKSIVLLKNDNALPLDPNSDFIYVTGPLASNNLALVGNYNGVNSNMKTIVEGVAGKISPSTRIQFRQGALLTTENKNSIDWFSGKAGDAEATIVVLGLTLLLEGEEGESIASPDKGDLLDMKLPESQLILLRNISEKAKSGGKKVITVVCAGMPLDLTEVAELSDAILYAWYPGERGGEAVADIIFGDVSPSGKLPITFPKSIDQLPSYEDYSMKGRTYRYSEKSPLYPFGYGLGYSKLEWSTPTISRNSLKRKQEVSVSLSIKNNGTIDAEDVIQLYLHLDNKTENLPLASLVDFKRVSIEKGKEINLSFKVPYEAFSFYNLKGEKTQHKGNATITIANASPNERAKELGAESVEMKIRIK